MIKKTLFICLASLFLFVKTAYAEDEPKFKATPSARLLIDGALYASPEKYLFKDGMAIPEARVGVKMEYGKWSSWIDVGIAYGKIGLRNMWIQYDFDNRNCLRAGNFLQPFGLQSVSTANVKNTFEAPLASALFNPGLQLGLMYLFHSPSFYSATAFHVESSALTNMMNYPQFNQQGYSLLTRFVWRSKDAGESAKPLFQAGLSLGFSTPERHLIDDYDVHDAFTNSVNFPTKVSNVTALSATIDNARNRFKLTPEIIVACRKLALESQYFFQTISRKYDLKNYNSSSFYVTLRGILKGGNYKYDAFNAQLSNPFDNALELVADYNYSDLNDSHSSLYFGKAHSFNITLNYYINKYITTKLNYTFTKVSGILNQPENDVLQNVVQLRLMVLF